MLPTQRRSLILQAIAERGAVLVADLAAELDVSAVTIRRDLDYLAESKLVVRSHGGAVSNTTAGTAVEPTYEVKRRSRVAEKALIGKAAAGEIDSDSEAVLIDAGSTTFEFAKQLRGRQGLVIVTNDLLIATELSRNSNHEVIMLGGSVRPGIFSTYGCYAEDVLRQLTLDTVFMGADAVSVSDGVMNANTSELMVKRLMVQSAKKKYLLVDSEKFGRIALARVCPLSAFDGIVTDTGIPANVAAEIRDMQVKLITVGGPEA